MNSPEEFLKKEFPEYPGFIEHTLVAKMAESYAKYYHQSQLEKVSDNQIIDHIENNCRSEKSETIMNEQEFYEGAKWCRDFLKNQ